MSNLQMGPELTDGTVDTSTDDPFAAWCDEGEQTGPWAWAARRK